MLKFIEFVDKRKRDAKRHLKIIKKLLESNHLKVAEHLDEDDPYVFLFTPEKSVNFGGVRIYQIGSQLAFRIQKEEKTHPFGQAYSLNIEDMFNDLMTDHHDPEKAGKAVIKSVLSEMQRFFNKSAKAEKDLRANEFDPKTGIAVRNTSTDFSNMVSIRGN